MHKAGFVNIIGLPNTGKSTLLNQLLGQKLSIVTSKAQTTRERIKGIVNGEEYQIVFCDSPGYINQPAYLLQKNMNAFVDESFEDADVILFVTDKFQTAEEQQHLIDLMQKKNIPGFVVLNKMDLCQPEELKQLTEYWKKKLPQCDVIPLSAASGINSKKVLKKIVELLPESPPYFDKEIASDRQLRFFVTEIVREKIFLNYTHEIPYSCQVEIESYEEGEKLDRIRCIIYVERESQKGILIGKKGEALKKTGTEARKEIESFIGKKVHLELFIKVKDKWRNNLDSLKMFGYTS